MISAAAALVLMLVAVGSFIAAVRFEKLASDNAPLVTEKSALAENLQAALSDSQVNLTRARDQEQKAKENLSLATNEQQRAEENLDLSLKALDAVYLQAIGRGHAPSQLHRLDLRPSPGCHRQLSTAIGCGIKRSREGARQRLNVGQDLSWHLPFARQDKSCLRDWVEAVASVFFKKPPVCR